jgi:hypothetical protein
MCLDPHSRAKSLATSDCSWPKAVCHGGLKTQAAKPSGQLGRLMPQARGGLTKWHKSRAQRDYNPAEVTLLDLQSRVTGVGVDRTLFDFETVVTD